MPGLGKCLDCSPPPTPELRAAERRANSIGARSTPPPTRRSPLAGLPLIPEHQEDLF